MAYDSAYPMRTTSFKGGYIEPSETESPTTHTPNSLPHAHDHWRAAYLGHVGCESAEGAKSNFMGDNCCEDEKPSSYRSDVIRVPSHAHVPHDSAAPGIKKNSVTIENSPLGRTYENVNFHKNLKKVNNWSVNDNVQSNRGDSNRVTSSAKFTLNYNPELQNSFPARSRGLVSFQEKGSNELLYEDWCSCIDGENNYLGNVKDSDSYDSVSFGKRCDSPESVHSEASSFYYTAGANTVYEAIKAVRESLGGELECSSENETDRELISSDEATYNTSLRENYSKCPDPTPRTKYNKLPSPGTSSGSDLIDQLNELQEKYFGNAKAANSTEEDHKLLSNGTYDEALQSHGVVRAVPCVVLTDSDNQELCNSMEKSSLKKGVVKSKRPISSASYSGSALDSSSADEVPSHCDVEESEISECDRRVSGVWTTGTGGEADEESFGENSESTSDSKTYESYDRNLLSYPLRSSDQSSDTSCHKCHQLLKNLNCSCKCNTQSDLIFVTSQIHPIMDPYAASLSTSRNLNDNYGYEKIPPTCETKYPSEARPFRDDWEKSTLSDALHSDPSARISDTEAAEDNSLFHSYLNVPFSELDRSPDETKKERTLEDTSRTSLLDDVINCLGSKWPNSSQSSTTPSPERHSSSHGPSPAKKSEASQTKLPTKSRSFRSGKPPVSPGSRTREGAGSSVLRTSSLRRSRSASAGAKLRACSTNPPGPRPASFVGLPRPSSLGDMVPGTSDSGSQESLHYISLMPLDDLAPRPQW